MKNNVVVAYDMNGKELIQFHLEVSTPDEAYEYVLRLQKMTKKAKRTKKNDGYIEQYRPITKVRRYWKTGHVDLDL